MEKEKNDENLPDENLNADIFLQILVAQANSYGVEPGITLYVGGIIISGRLISRKKYFKEFAEQYKSGFNEELKEFGETIGDTFAMFGEDYNQKSNEAADSETDSSNEAPLVQKK